MGGPNSTSDASATPTTSYFLTGSGAGSCVGSCRGPAPARARRPTLWDPFARPFGEPVPVLGGTCSGSCSGASSGGVPTDRVFPTASSGPESRSLLASAWESTTSPRPSTKRPAARPTDRISSYEGSTPLNETLSRPTGATVETLEEAASTPGRPSTSRVSSGVRVLAAAAPNGPLSPPSCSPLVPGLTVIRLGPRSFIWPEMLFCMPFPNEASSTTAATPMTMPSMVRIVRPQLTNSPERPMPAIRNTRITPPPPPRATSRRRRPGRP